MNLITLYVVSQICVIVWAWLESETNPDKPFKNVYSIYFLWSNAISGILGLMSEADSIKLLFM